VDGPSPDFEDAFRAEYSAVVRLCAPIVGSVPDAEAVAQDAFLKAFLRWKRLSRYDRPGAWIRRVAIRDAVRFAERQRRTLPAPVSAPDPADTASARVDLDGAIAHLSPRQRACVVLCHLAAWPVGDTAEALGCSEATVRVHLHRARAALAVALATSSEELTDGA
jgi:RNA polymerase sigma-70 factor (ECF subfamily)